MLSMYVYSGGGFYVFDVINTIALSVQFVGRNTPAICSRIFQSRIFSAPTGTITLYRTLADVAWQ